MAPSFSIDLKPLERGQLLGIARQSIQSGLNGDGPVNVCLDGLAHPMTALFGVFVTLTRDAQLRGCIGALESSEPLVRAVSDSAYSAAFHDPRFPQLQRHELDAISIEISVLSTMQAFAVGSREELLANLQPGRDGLLLQDGHYRSTFLPQVWEQLPVPELFLGHLLAKAGLPEDHWSETLRFQRYQSMSFSETAR